jgi:hypothetical protein
MCGSTLKIFALQIFQLGENLQNAPFQKRVFVNMKKMQHTKTNKGNPLNEF